MKKGSLAESLKKLEGITDWFENQETIDVEQALEKVKEGVALIKESKLRLKEVDVAFLVLQQLFEQRHGHIVLFVAADLA